MNDDEASKVIDAILNLAVTVRDEIGQGVTDAAQAVIKAAGDPLAALVVAAALVRVDEPVDAWWQESEFPPTVDLDKLRAAEAASAPILAPCGTHAAYNRHKKRGEPVDMACQLAERMYHRSRLPRSDKHRAYQRERKRAQRAKAAMDKAAAS